MCSSARLQRTSTATHVESLLSVSAAQLLERVYYQKYVVFTLELAAALELSSFRSTLKVFITLRSVCSNAFTISGNRWEHVDDDKQTATTWQSVQQYDCKQNGL
jgi:hypothetical protein